MKNLKYLLFAGILLGACTACSNKSNETKELKTEALSVIHETKFNSSYAGITNEEFLNYGFTYGDSCNVTFSNGVKFEDVPFFDGYYTRSGKVLICAYQGYPYLQITINNSSTFWDDMNLSENDTVTIERNEEGKYKTIQDTFSMHYSTDRKEYKNDAEFANYRVFKSGALKEKTLYRGASPFNNQYNRVPYVDSLLKEDKVNFILDLADSEDDLENYFKNGDFSNCYAKGLVDNGHYAALNMGSNFRSEKFAASLVEGIRKLNQFDGPFYVHCTEGKDRTGFVCTLFAGLAGANYEEMKQDYMETYENYFKIHAGEDKYEAVVELRFNEFLEYLAGTTDINVLKNTSYIDYCKNYLLNVGLTSDEVTTLNSKITNFLYK